MARVGGVNELEIEYTPEGYAVLAGDPCLSKWVREQKRLDTDGLLRNPQGIRQFVKPNWIIADVGAYIGDHTWTYGTWVPQGHVYGFEPQAEAYRCALHNCRELPHVTVVRALVTDGASPRVLHRDRSNYGASHVASSEELGRDSDPIHVPLVTTLDDFFQDDKLDFIKIDVEGFESHVLRGGQRLIARWRPYLLVEIGIGQQARYGYSVEKLLDLMRAYGYHLIDSDGTTLTPEKLARLQWDCIAVPRR